MSIKVNGEEVEWIEGESIYELLKRLSYSQPYLIVKMNGKFVPRDSHKNTTVPNGTEITVVPVVSGG